MLLTALSLSPQAMTRQTLFHGGEPPPHACRSRPRRGGERDHGQPARALRGGVHVARATLERVEAAARALNYVPNRLAGTLAGGQSRQVAVVLPLVVQQRLCRCAGRAGDASRTGQPRIPFSACRITTPSTRNGWWPTCCRGGPRALSLGAGRQHRGERGGCWPAPVCPWSRSWISTPAPIDMSVGLSQRAGGGGRWRITLLGRGYRRVAYVGHDISTDPLRHHAQAGGWSWGWQRRRSRWRPR